MALELELELALEFGVIMRPKRDGSNHFEKNLVSRGDDLMHKKKKDSHLNPAEFNSERHQETNPMRD